MFAAGGVCAYTNSVLTHPKPLLTVGTVVN